MVHRINMKTHVLVTSDSGKLKLKGDNRILKKATESKDQPRPYIEVE